MRFGLLKKGKTQPGRLGTPIHIRQLRTPVPLFCCRGIHNTHRRSRSRWKGPKQQYVEIWPITFHNDDTFNAQLKNTGKIVVALQPTSHLYFVVKPIPEALS